MSSSAQTANNNQGGVIPAGNPSQILPPGTVGINPQSSLNPNVAHTKGDLDNHANQLNPNNPRYAGHQERLAAAGANQEAAVLHQEAQAAYQYANEMEAAAIQAQVAASQLKQQATLYAQQAATGLNTRGGNQQSNDNQGNDGNDDYDEEGHDEQQENNDKNQRLPQRQTNQS